MMGKHRKKIVRIRILKKKSLVILSESRLIIFNMNPKVEINLPRKKVRVYVKLISCYYLSY